MLRFNLIKYIVLKIEKNNLNTYHVKVQSYKSNSIFDYILNLNTYHVKVQYYCIFVLFLNCGNLNTYHVKVQFTSQVSSCSVVSI